MLDTSPLLAESRDRVHRQYGRAVGRRIGASTRINPILRKSSMKYIASGLLVLGLLAVQMPEANAAACAAGVYHAGCVGPRGAVVTRRPVYAHPVRVAPRCYYRAGVRVCR